MIDPRTQDMRSRWCDFHEGFAPASAGQEEQPEQEGKPRLWRCFACILRQRRKEAANAAPAA